MCADITYYTLAIAIYIYNKYNIFNMREVENIGLQNTEVSRSIYTLSNIHACILLNRSCMHYVTTV